MGKKLSLTDIGLILKNNSISNVSKSVKNKNLLKIERELNKYNINKAVLGIDIYRYSQYPNIPQMLIPYLFKTLYADTLANCITHEPFIFKGLTTKILSQQFIDTGDGGFQIFDNPLQAIIFAIYFQANTSRYNSIHKPLESLFEIVDEITLRYSLTFDNVFSFENNYFGPSIINCARIMSKDTLNRFLIDENTKKWFSKELNGIESLQVLEIEKDCEEISVLKKGSTKQIKSVVFKDSKCKILKVDLMKIGEIKSKMDILSIYNLNIQTLMYSPSSRFKKHTINLGNLNSNGLT